MRLIDCFSDVFTFTLHFMDAVESGHGPAQQGERGAPPPPKPQAAAPTAAPTGLAALLSTPAAPKAKETTPTAKETESTSEQSAKTGDKDVSRFTFDMVRDSYHRLFRQSQEMCQRGHVPQTDFDMAKFAVCAWVDEMISCSNWNERMRWPKEELQRVYFQTTNAGEEFYAYLRELTLTQKDVLEVYATCLSLGFQGRYFGKYGQDELEGIRLATVRRLLGQSPDADALGQSRKLFPDAYSTKDRSKIGTMRQAFTRLAIFGIAIAPLILLLVLYITFSTILGRYLGQYKIPTVPSQTEQINSSATLTGSQGGATR